MELSDILAIGVLLYCIQVGVLFVGLLRRRDESFNNRMNVSVVIAARNEEETIARCLTSVLAQTYSSNLFEVILMNDGSTDATERIATSFTEQHPNLLVRAVEDDRVMKGKANALAQGIDRAKGELILITDADCVVPPTWIEETVRRYGPKVGVMGGMTLQEAQTAFEGMQALDWSYLLGVAASTAALGVPLTSIGNNFSFRREAYGAVGGYRNIPFSVTEDYMLFQSIIQTKKWEYAYPLSPSLLVMSKPCRSWQEIIRQKRRWGTGGKDMRLSGFMILAVGFILHAGLLTGLVLGYLTEVLTACLLKCIADYCLLHRTLANVGRTDLLKYFFAFQLYFILYVVALPFLVFFGGRVVWKGRTY